MSMQPRNFVRSSHGVIAGVCRGLAERIDIEPWIVRIIWLISICFLGTGFLVYILCIFAFPREDRLDRALEPKVLGVCLRLGQKIDVEVALIRFIALLLLVTSLGTTIIVYIILHFLLKDDNDTRSLV